jgi:hypothetical protein
MGTGDDRGTQRWLFGKCDIDTDCSGGYSGNKSMLTVVKGGESMRAMLSFILLLAGALLIGITVENSIVGSTLVKAIGTLFMIGFLGTFPKKEGELY